jgi:hypothetical protein
MAETVLILGEGGHIFEMVLPLSEPIADRLLKGYLKRVNVDGSPWVEKAEKRKPYANESKNEWVSWAVHNGMTPDDADAFTKQDLIEKFGV